MARLAMMSPSRLRENLKLAAEVVRTSGGRALIYRLRRIAAAALRASDQLNLPVAPEDVLAADRGAPGPEPQRVPKPPDGRLTINWILPTALAGSGGQTTIFRFVRQLESKGHTNRLYFYNPMNRISFREVDDVIRRWYPPMTAELRPYVPGLEPCDAVIATMWPTAYAAYNDSVRAKRFYLVQDYEPYFYPSGTERALAANTYRFGFHGITAGPWLAEKLFAEFGMGCDHYDFGVDPVKYVNEERPLRRGVVFYARPGTPWRGFELGVLALRLFHADHPDHEIHLVGRNMSAGRMPRGWLNHGNLQDEGLNRLYNRCAAGLVLSFTNMSLLPMELLATGCIPVVNEAPSNHFIRGSECIEYAEPSPRALAAALSSVVARPDAHERARHASESVRTCTWDAAAAQVEKSLLHRLGGAPA